MFAASPVTNPDGSTGIQLIQDYGQGGLFSGGNVVPEANTLIIGRPSDPEFQGYKSTNFAPNRQNYFHYVLMGHRLSHLDYTGYLGIAEVVGDDILITMNCQHANVSWVKGTIAHELGHNLGLRHGGEVNNFCNFKPNYNSIMNYRYTTLGVDLDCDFEPNGLMDYSHGDRPPLDENNLDENQGVCGPNPPGPVVIDWNNNGTLEASVVRDINPSDTAQGLACGGVLTVLTDHDDWSNLVFMPTWNIADGAFIPPPDIIACEPPLSGVDP